MYKLLILLPFLMGCSLSIEHTPYTLLGYDCERVVLREFSMKESIHACEDEGLVPMAATKHASKMGVISAVVVTGAIVGGSIAAAGSINTGVGDISIGP